MTEVSVNQEISKSYSSLCYIIGLNVKGKLPAAETFLKTEICPLNKQKKF